MDNLNKILLTISLILFLAYLATIVGVFMYVGGEL